MNAIRPYIPDEQPEAADPTPAAANDPMFAFVKLGAHEYKRLPDEEAARRWGARRGYAFDGQISERLAAIIEKRG